MSKQKKNKHWLLDREMPQMKKQTRFREVKFKLGGRVPDGWTIRDFLECFGFVVILLLAVLAAHEIFGLI